MSQEFSRTIRFGVENAHLHKRRVRLHYEPVKYPQTARLPTILLRHRKIRPILERNLAEAHENYQAALHNPDKTKQAVLIATLELQSCHWALDQHKSRIILWKAEKFGLEVPTFQEKPSWWRDDGEDGQEPVIRWLSEKGRQGLQNLIRDERRKTWEWRVRVITPILTILVSILGLLVAAVSLLNKNR